MDQDGDQVQTAIPSIGNSVNRDRDPYPIDVVPMPFIEEPVPGKLLLLKLEIGAYSAYKG